MWWACGRCFFGYFLRSLERFQQRPDSILSGWRVRVFLFFAGVAAGETVPAGEVANRIDYVKSAVHAVFRARLAAESFTGVLLGLLRDDEGERLREF